MEPIVIETQIKSSIETVWNCFTAPEHVMGWNFATEDWCCPSAESDFVVGGKFCYNMAAKDGSMSFDYWGIFRQIHPCHSIEYSLGEDLGESRWVKVEFMELADAGIVSVKETFVPEDENPIEMQRMGWEMILANFKKYCESIG